MHSPSVVSPFDLCVWLFLGRHPSPLQVLERDKSVPQSPVSGKERQVQPQRQTLHTRNAHRNLFSLGSFCTRSGVDLSRLSSAGRLARQNSACDARRVNPPHTYVTDLLFPDSQDGEILDLHLTVGIIPAPPSYPSLAFQRQHRF